MRLLLLGGIIGPILFAVVVVAAAAMRPDYDHVHQFISELGATGSTNAAFMNYAGFLPAGLLVAGFGLALSRTLPRAPLDVVGSVLVVLFGTGIAASGIVSCDAGCPQDAGSVQNVIHNRVAPAGFFCAILAAGIFGFRFRALGAWRGLAWPSAVAALLSMLLLGALAGSLETRRMTGAWQRGLLLVLFSWCALVGVRAYRLSSSDTQGSPAA